MLKQIVRDGVMKNSVLNMAAKWMVMALVVLIFGASFEEGTLEEMFYYIPDIIYLGEQHMVLALSSGLVAILVGIPLGVILSRPKVVHLAEYVMQFLNVGATIPTLALLAMSMTFLGIGFLPAAFGLFVITLLPIVRNTYTGLRSVPDALNEAARGMGMTPMQQLIRVELPNSLSVIFAGIRTAFSLNIGTVPIAFLIGGGGLGELVFMGIRLDDTSMMLAGAGATALLAVIVDISLGVLSQLCIPKGINLAADKA